MLSIISIGLGCSGVLHLVFGLFKFREPLAASLRAGFINQFKSIDAYAAFWFLLSGPPLILAGHLSHYCASTYDWYALKLIGTYTFVSCLVGVVAFPRSPFWLPTILSLMLLAEVMA